MRTQFPGYFRPSEAEFKQMWHEGLFAFDTNILLNIYRYTEQTQSSLFGILDRLVDRIWIPHQVAKEFLDHRLGVITKQSNAYQEVEKLFEESLTKLERQLMQYK